MRQETNMPDHLGWTIEEQSYLTDHYRFQFHIPINVPVYPAGDLLFREPLLNFLNKAGRKIDSNELTVTASLFFKRYAFCGLTSSLYAMTMLNKAFDMRLNNIVIIDQEAEDMWLPSFTLKNLHGTSLTGNRKQWRSAIVKTLFADNMTIMLEHLAKETRAPKAMLWENARIYIVWLYETWLKENHSESIQKRIQDDYQFIIHDAEPYHFGTMKKNPFFRFEHDHQERQRQTCCLYYRTENGTCCTTCPRKNLRH